MWVGSPLSHLSECVAWSSVETSALVNELSFHKRTAVRALAVDQAFVWSLTRPPEIRVHVGADYLNRIAVPRLLKIWLRDGIFSVM